jgi:hypothetical protein
MLLQVLLGHLVRRRHGFLGVGSTAFGNKLEPGGGQTPASLPKTFRPQARGFSFGWRAHNVRVSVTLKWLEGKIVLCPPPFAVRPHAVSARAAPHFRPGPLTCIKALLNL